MIIVKQINRVLELVQEKPGLYSRDISKALGMSSGGVSGHLNALKKKGRIRSEGPYYDRKYYPVGDASA